MRRSGALQAEGVAQAGAWRDQHEVEAENLDLTRQLGRRRQRGSRGAQD